MPSGEQTDLPPMTADGTPGPWFIENHGIMDATRSRTICIFGDSDQDDADLELVASAPDLRDELRSLRSAVWRIVNEVDECNHVTTEGGDRFMLTDLEAAAVRAALFANEPF